MPITLLSALARLSAGTLLLQASIPAVLPLKESLDAREARNAALSAALKKATAPPPPMKGVPLMRLTQSVRSAAGILPRTREDGTILNEVGGTDSPVSDARRAAWRAELASGREGKGRAGLLRLWLAEADLAREYPASAIERIDALLKTSPTPEVRGLALHDRAECLFYSGRYGDARRAFEAELHGKQTGFDRRQAALWVRHARGCEGYHLDNERLGVPLPPGLDPLCGAAAVAVCLRALGLAHQEGVVSKAVRHTGEGSNLQDLVDACDRLGVAANPVQATEKGLRSLPLPVVAHVEGDHFVSVVRADKGGVEYVCSDCGAWPGGAVRVSWKAWQAMRPGAFMTVARRGSPLAEAMDRLAPRAETKKSGSGARTNDVSVGMTQGRLAGQAARLASTLVGSVASLQLAPYYRCQFRPNALQCPDGVGPCCPKDASGPQSRSYGATSGEPVNLATGEEQYTPDPDLYVYNPNGPSVSWSRIYNSLRVSGANEFGIGWSNPYNVGVKMPAGPPPGYTRTGSVVLANGGAVSFSAVAPTTSTPVVATNVAPGIALKVDWHLDTTTGLEFFVVTFPDRTKWTTSESSDMNFFHRIVRLEDRVGNWIGFAYGPYATMPAYGPYTSISQLTRIYDSANVTLLSVGLDSSNNAVSVSDRYGRSVYYTYGTSGIGAGQLYQVSQIVATGTTSPAVRYQYGYVSEGNGEQTSGYPYLGSISVPSPTGTGMATATIGYDAFSGFVTSTTDANGNRREYAATDWNGTTNANLTTVKVKDPLGNLVQQYTVGFDAQMNTGVRKNAIGQTVSTPYYGSGGASYRPATTTDGNGRVLNTTYDAFGNPVTQMTPKGTVTTWSYDYTQFPLGELTSVQEGSKTAISYTYDEPSGHIHSITKPVPGQSGSTGIQTETYSYDQLGNLTAASCPGNGTVSSHTITMGYTIDGGFSQAEGLGKPITVTDTLGLVKHMRYDARGNMTTVIDPSGNASTVTYDLADKPVLSLLPATGQTGTGNMAQTLAYLYTGGPLLRSEQRDESGALVRTATGVYGAEGEILGTGGTALTKGYTYDPAYRIKSVTNGNNAMSYLYDASGRISQVTQPGAGVSGYDTVTYTSYDPVGNVLSKTDGRGQVTQYTYGDPDGELTQVNYIGNSQFNIAYTYDAYDRVIGVTDSTGSSARTFDDLDALTSSTQTYTGLPTQTISYSFWPDGSRRTMVNPAGTWTYTYDGNGRYATMTSPAGTSYASYYDNGWQQSRTLPNGAVTQYAYNALGQKTSQQSAISGTLLDTEGNFHYDGGLNLTALDQTVTGLPSLSGTTSFTYDGQNRLTGESSGRLGGYSQSHAYDSSGNATTLRGVSQTFNADNQPIGTPFVYDGSGNPTTYRSTSIAYDPENHPISIGSAWSATYRFDGLRSSKTASGTKSYYLYDGGRPIVELDASGNVKAYNVFAPDGLVARQSNDFYTEKPVKGGQTSGFTAIRIGLTEYTFDPQGDVAQRLDSAGNVQSSSAFDAYGVESSPGGTPSDPFGYKARMGYYLDRENGLYLCQHRYYDPQLGHWLTRDPIGRLGGINLYRYVGNGPSTGTDPTGESEWGQVFQQCVISGVGTMLLDLLQGGTPNPAISCDGIGACLGALIGTAIELLCEEATDVVAACVGGMVGSGCQVAATKICEQILHNDHDCGGSPPVVHKNPLCYAIDMLANMLDSCLSGLLGGEQDVMSWLSELLNDMFGTTGSWAGTACDNASK